ncbi:hypothetical protein [Streptomyces sp. I05A-00742]|uniref:hypothetical protein n=1 Tax=Streptomyces sp. I05A-00742 TaxID=2732853 RepID=UPI001489CA97|nr:hypothetical protein [Streptomyces sp. I05A-00742]
MPSSTTTGPTTTGTPAGPLHRLRLRLGRRLGEADGNWAKPPAIASLLCAPVLCLYAYYGGPLRTGGLESALPTAVFAGVVALLLAWVLPHRKATRFSRIAFSVTGTALVMLPILIGAVAVLGMIFLV